MPLRGRIYWLKGIPFIKIADHVDANFHLKWKRVSGPPLSLE
jgi:hypothetical protein